MIFVLSYYSFPVLRIKQIFAIFRLLNVELLDIH